MRLIADELQILVAHLQQAFESAQALAVVPDFEARQRQRLSGKKLFNLLKMITVDVIITERVDEFARFQTADVRDEMS